MGTVKETIQQVSISKKWDSKPALDEHGKPLLNANGKTVLRKSYSVLQDDFFAAMRKAGYDDVERGERGSSEEHLTVTQFKVQQEQARLAEFTEQNRQQEKLAATLGSKIEKIQNQRVDVRSIEKIVATSIPFSSKVAVEREDFDRLSTLAKKYVTAEKKESKLQKALDAANKLIAKLKAEIDSLKQEISDYKSVHSKLRAAELERENTELRGKVRSYEDVIQRNNLWRFFHPLRKKRSRGTKLADSCVEPEKTHFIEWERVGQGRHRPARSCLKIAIFPKSKAKENPRKTPLLRDGAAERISL